MSMRELNVVVDCRDNRRIEVIANGLAWLSSRSTLPDPSLLVGLRRSAPPTPAAHCRCCLARYEPDKEENMSQGAAWCRLVVLCIELGGR